MTDKSARILRPVHFRFRQARVLCERGSVSVLSNSPDPTLQTQPVISPAVPTLTSPVLPLPEPLFVPQVRDAGGVDERDKPPRSTPPARKARAQVAPLVRPQVVSPKSCELKLGRYRPYRLMGRFSEEEKASVETKAAAASLSVNEYIRATVLGPDYKPPVDPEWTKALLASNRELTRQGNNLNQIAHRRNANLIDEAQTDSLLGILARAYFQTHRAVRAALSQGKEPQP